MERDSSMMSPDRCEFYAKQGVFVLLCIPIAAVFFTLAFPFWLAGLIATKAGMTPKWSDEIPD